MSRYSFDEIIANIDELNEKYNLENLDGEDWQPQDKIGYGLTDWLRDGIVGWDPNLESYFIQQGEVVVDGCDTLDWWLGVTPKQIPTFEVLCTVINHIFDNQVAFEFNNIIALAGNEAGSI